MTGSDRNIVLPLALAASVGVLAAVAGIAFAGWMEHAPAIFATLVEQGMAWCF